MTLTFLTGFCESRPLSLNKADSTLFQRESPVLTIFINKERQLYEQA
jgi:hypothetical protein